MEITLYAGPQPYAVFNLQGPFAYRHLVQMLDNQIGPGRWWRPELVSEQYQGEPSNRQIVILFEEQVDMTAAVLSW